MIGDQLLNPDGTRALNADGTRAIAAANCECCGPPSSSCTRCSGPTPGAISIAFSGIAFRNLTCNMCGNERYSWLINPNGAFTLDLIEENQFGCSYGLQRPNAVNRLVFALPNCSTLVQNVNFDLGIVAAFPRSGGYSILVDVATPVINRIFDHLSSGSQCIRDRVYQNQLPTGYQDGCQMGGGGGQATISF